MTDATLLQAILDDPDDIAARRVYADSLIAAGDPRGELINVQCAIDGATPADRAALIKRETALLKANKKAWFAPYHGSLRSPEFTRGFIEHASVTPLKFVPVADTLFAAEPVTSLAIRDLSSSGAIALGKAQLGRLRELRVTRSKLGKLGVRGLFARPMSRLRRLDLAHGGIDDAGLAHLSSAVFGQLERLGLAGAKIDPTKLLGDPNLARLAYLRLDWVLNRIDGAELLAYHLALPNLTHLDLTASQLAGSHLRTMTRNPVFRGLRGLGLEQNSLTDADAIASLAALERLEVLDVSTNDLDAGAIAAIARLSCPLRVLRLYQSHVSDRLLADLAKGTFPLKRLDLGYGQASAAGLAAIGRAGWPLETLELWSCQIGDAGAAALAAADFSSTMRELSLGYCSLTDAGLHALAKAAWPRLEKLTFRGSTFTKAGIAALATLPALRTVKFDLESPAMSILRPLIDRGVRIA